MLPDEAAHSQYEMKSFVKSDTGVLYPKGQGKSADSHSLLLDTSVTVGISSKELRSIGDASSKPFLTKHSKDKLKIRSEGVQILNEHDQGLPVSCIYSSMNTSSFEKKYIKTQSSLLHEDDINVDEESHVLRLADVNDTNWRARETRLTAYDDAIMSVIRKVQSRSPDIVDVVEFKGNIDTDQYLQFDAKRVEREARILDTIDAVIAQAKSRSPSLPKCLPPSNLEYSEQEDKSVTDPVAVESSDNILLSITTSSELSKCTEQSIRSPKQQQSATISDERLIFKKSKLRRDKSGIQDKSQLLKCSKEINIFNNEKCEDSIYDENMKGGKDLVLNNRNDKLHVQPGMWTEDDESVLPIAAAESLMKLAGVVPPPRKRLRISFGLGKERTVENPTTDKLPYCDKFTESQLELSKNLQLNQYNADQSGYQLMEFQSEKIACLEPLSQSLGDTKKHDYHTEKDTTWVNKKYRKQSKKCRLKSRKDKWKKQKVSCLYVIMIFIIYLLIY